MQRITVSRRAIQVIASNVKVDIILRGNWRFLPGQIQRHTLRHKIFDVEIPHALLVIARIRANMPHAGLGAAIERIVEAIKAVLRLHNDRTRHLSVRAQHVKFYRLIGKRFAIAVAKQAVQDHRFTRTIEIARAKHKELFAVTRVTGDIKLRQIQRRKFEVEKRRLAIFTGQDQRGFFIGLQFRMTIGVAVRLGQGLPFIVQKGNGHT